MLSLDVQRKDRAQRKQRLRDPSLKHNNSTFMLGKVLSPLDYGEGNRFVDGATQASTGSP